MTAPSREQYRLGVRLGHLIAESRERGVSWDEIIQTLGHAGRISEDAQLLDLLIAERAARAGAATL